MNSLIAPSPFSGIGHSHQKFIHCTDNIQMSQSSVRISPHWCYNCPPTSRWGGKKKKKCGDRTAFVGGQTGSSWAMQHQISALRLLPAHWNQKPTTNLTVWLYNPQFVGFFFHKIKNKTGKNLIIFLSTVT